MRGKLRDKRVTTKRDSTKRELIERRKPSKRDSRIVIWLNQEVDGDEDELDLLEDEEETSKTSDKK